MREEHFHFLSELHRDVVLWGLGDIAGNLAGVLVFLARNLARVCIRTAFRFRWACLAGQFQCAISCGALSGRATGRVRIISSELLQSVALRADVLIVFSIPLEVGAGLGAIVAP